jgi:hypothetical protein
MAKENGFSKLTPDAAKEQYKRHEAGGENANKNKRTKKKNNH